MEFLSRNLAWKLIVPIICFFVIVFVLFVSVLPKTLYDNTTNITISNAEENAARLKKLRTYYAKNIVSSVTGTDGISASTNHKDKSGVIPVPATFLHDVSYEMSSDNTRYALYSPYPFSGRSDRQLDEFGRKAWDALQKNPDQVYSEMADVDGRQIMRVGIGDTLTANTCVSCHNSHPNSPKTDWQQGDLRGVLEVSIDITDERRSDSMLASMIIGTLFVLLIAVLAVIKVSFSRNIQQKVRSITTAVDRIVDGDLTTQLDTRGNQDELAVIMKSINRITQRYSETITMINSSANQLKGKVSDLIDITAQSDKGTKTQSKLTIATESSMAKMVETVQCVVSSAAQATEAASSAQEVSEDGKRVVSGSVDVIETIAQQAQASTAIIGQLQSNVEKIGTVSSVIGAIAEQTNLLALNAAIEAARAGEQGRGFAVVADEVRNLASKTMNSTDEIYSIIKELQETTSDLVSAMAASNDQADAAVQQIQNTRESLSSISEKVDEITLVNDGIKSSTEFQIQVVDKVNLNVSQIAEISQSVEQGSKEITQGATELNEVAQEMLAFCQSFKSN